LVSCGCLELDQPIEMAVPSMDDLASFGDSLVPCGLDANGYPLFRARHGDIDVLVHVADVPQSDLTEVRGIRCTTALRTVIDLASSTEPDGVRSMVASALRKSLFTAAELRDRLAQPDMLRHPGAVALREALDVDGLVPEPRPWADQ